MYQDVMSDVQVSSKCIILLLDEQKQTLLQRYFNVQVQAMQAS